MREQGNLGDIIKDVEKKWLNEATAFVERHFESFFLPSHDLSHHFRVWNNTKSILNELSEINTYIDYPLVEASLLSALFHDTGMVLTRDPVHGVQSVKCYLDFLKENKHETPEYQKEIISTIELHDQKDSYLFQAFEINSTPDLLTLVSIADDLDALGIIGIYRYTEIYLHRRIQLRSLGIKILDNVSQRFNHIKKASLLLPGLLKSAKQPYKEIINFFDNYNQQLLLETKYDDTFSGHLGIVNYLKQFCVEDEIKPEEFNNEITKFTVGNTIRSFFEDLDKALNEK